MKQVVIEAPSTRMSLPLAAEERLLLVCARGSLSPANREELEGLLEQTLRWDQVVEKAQWHRLAPLVFHHLRSTGYSSQVPKHVLRRLQGLYRHNIARQLYLRAELGRVLDALRARAIPVIVLKGAALVETVYADPGLRPMVDLDLLVPDELVHDAQAVVRSLGYQPGGIPEDREDTERNHRHLPVLMGVGKPVVVEIHRHIVRLDSPLHFDIEGLWRRARGATIAGAHVKVLGAEDLLLHLSLNFFLDRRFGSGAALGQLCDIAEVVRCYENIIEWPALVERVQRYGLAGPTGCALFLAQRLLDAPVPADVSGQLRPQGFGEHEVARFALRRVLGTQPWVARELVPPGSLYRPAAVLRAMLRRVVPSRRYMISRYGSPARGKAGLLMYLVRLGQGLAILLRFAVRPSALKEDVSIDRWLHSLYGRRDGDSEGDF